MAASKGLQKLTILVLILAVPGFLYYLLTAKGKNRYKPLPYYGAKKLSGTSHKFHGKIIPDTLYHTVPDFTLTDQQGKQVSLKSIGEKILVLNFFYTNCGDACKEVNARMDSLVKRLAKNDLMQFASITVDPQRDNVPALQKFSAGFNRPADKWLFLTGDTSTIYPLARNGLLVDALQDGDNFVLSNKIILLDSDHHIRGYYDVASTSDATRLGDEIKVQITEELRKKEKPLY
ncbi:SCO family protein [Mucilaginibacter myungsuensis]|uniref:SCO family protein n=1 Tax=Mucilaginibacter myungsuensis TaxID=649104 RepID=A0A929L1J6_9SPHI|nr:SCO family protein [Mucilaginibacter myungsuensis]MBE9664438.1 SCO family protein [Mucilaginibacter myungsuensis]MDN3601417.1 SCO family protein [Mucilaginibacter myungsuensis]